MRLWEHTGTIRSGGPLTLHSTGPDDPVRTMTVERTRKDDGRYLLYYSWPTDDAERPEPEPDQAADDDV
jgi:hypothetical protein